MDALTISPASAPAVSADAALRADGNEPNQGPSFGQVLAEQSTEDSDTASSEQDAAGQQQVAADQTQADKPAKTTPLETATDADTDDVGRVAVAAALVQWLAVAPQPVATAPDPAPQAVGLAPASTPVPAASSDIAPVVASAAVADFTVIAAPALGAEGQAADQNSQSQAQSALPVDLQTAPAPAGSGFQSFLSQPLQVVQSTAAATTTADMPRAAVDSPVGDHGWAQELGTRLAVMTARGEQSGSLKLNPEHLGPLEVQIRVKDSDVTVAFGAQHADTRAALNEALPRLREMFAQSGLQLTDAGVSRDGTRQSLPPRLGRSMLAGRDDAVSGIETAVSVAGLRHAGMIDAIA